MKNLILLMLIGSAVASLSCSSPRRANAPVSHEINTNASSQPTLSLDARQIRDERPDVTYETLANDEAVVREAWFVVWDRLQRKGFSQEDARDATLVSWRELRVNRLQPQEPLTVPQLETYASSLGKLVINSTPSEADVEIEAQAFDRKTNTAAWLGPGQYRVKVSKSGFMPEENSYTVHEGTKTEAYFTLRPAARQ